MLAVPAVAQVVGAGSCATWFADSFWCHVDGRTADYSATGSVNTFEIGPDLYEVQIQVSTSGTEFPTVFNAASVTITDDNLDECFVGITDGTRSKQCVMTSFDGQFYFELDAQ